MAFRDISCSNVEILRACPPSPCPSAPRCHFVPAPCPGCPHPLMPLRASRVSVQAAGPPLRAPRVRRRGRGSRAWGAVRGEPRVGSSASPRAARVEPSVGSRAWGAAPLAEPRRFARPQPCSGRRCARPPRLDPRAPFPSGSSLCLPSPPVLFHFHSFFSASSSPLWSGKVLSLLVFITSKRFSDTTFASFGSISFPAIH